MKFFSRLIRAGGAKLLLGGLGVSLLIGGSSMFSPVRASDHDDGETNIKTKNTNLTDLYAFRQDWETGVTGDKSNLVLVMNSNPRSVPRQQYFFNTNAFYNLSLTRNPGNTNAAGSGANATVTGREDVRLAFSFGIPSSGGAQEISLQVLTFSNGNVSATQNFSNLGTTTPAKPLIGNPDPTAINNTINVAPLLNTNSPTTTPVNIFAGLREDPFFFDVEAFFRTRALLAGNTSPVGAGFGTTLTASDFAKGYNVNSIVVSVPIQLLQTTAGETCFDVWETITIPSTTAALQ